mmetsp:Transcript_7923/g.17121  ORF Transcript_7923/g.17121 Transcript_7923/m.17121 type:complete len:180 (-) Transcript_7923:252-791(-)
MPIHHTRRLEEGTGSRHRVVAPSLSVTIEKQAREETALLGLLFIFLQTFNDADSNNNRREGAEAARSPRRLDRQRRRRCCRQHAAANLPSFRSKNTIVVCRVRLHPVGHERSAVAEEGRVRNWMLQGEIDKFQKDLKPRLLDIFPGAMRIEYTDSGKVVASTRCRAEGASLARLVHLVE